MIWIDFAIVGLLCVTWFIGLLKGFSQQAYSLACWLVAIAVGLNFSREFAVFLRPAIDDATAQLAASFIALCWITLAVGGLIRWLLGGLIKKSGLTLVDRLGGMVVGAGHGLLWVAVLVMLAGLSVLPHDSPWWKKSKLIPPFQLVVVWLRDHWPTAVTKHVHYR